VKIPDRPDTADRLARIERLIETCRLAKQRRLMRLAMKIWRQTATDQQLAKLDGRPEQIH
jgi:hypothetical protein